jgi:hypothetical protein
MSVFVFLGPTLPLAEARGLLPEATWLPPAAVGDIYRLASAPNPPTAIALVDGLFEQVPSVWHKEILFALSRGIPVYGSSSMGALRACELADFGMVGVGGIFEAYRRGELEDDDEVAITHAPAEENFRPMSEAMVNLRDGLTRAEQAGVISPDTHQRLLGAAKALYYPERSWARVYQLGLTLALPREELTALQGFVQKERPDAKQRDAVALLKRLAREFAEGMRPHVPSFSFESTKYWIRLMQRLSPRSVDRAATGGATTYEILNYLRLTAGQHADIFRGALLLSLVTSEARLLGLEPTAEQRAAALARLRRSHGLSEADNLEELRTRGRMNREELEALIELEAQCGALLSLRRHDVEHRTITELQRRGTLGSTAAAADRKWRFLRQNGMASPTIADAGLSPSELLGWYSVRFRSIGGSVDTHSSDLGFASLREFYAEVLGQYLLERASVGGSEAGEP